MSDNFIAGTAEVT